MRTEPARVFLLCLVLVTGSMLMHGQIVGESETIKINMKKPGPGETGASDAAGRTVEDVAPPRLMIISPPVDTTYSAHVKTAYMYLIGRLTDESGIHSLMVNDSILPTDENGFFQKAFNLESGLNVVKIHASDIKSNATTQFLQLIYSPVSEEGTDAERVEGPGEYFALIIGIDEYRDPDLVDLDHPIMDASLLYHTLIGNYMFDPGNVALLKNPTRADIINKLDEFTYRLTESDNLLIFYAGHGYWDSERETGFWLPADADKLSSVNWIRNSTIQDYVDDIRTHHTLLITDACFAGSIFKSRGAFQDASIAVNKLYSLQSRKAMTSGTFEEVPDRSVFLEFLLKRLNENDKKYVSAGDLFSSFREAVLNNSPNIPQYGVIQDTGDEGGDFIFIKR